MSSFAAREGLRLRPKSACATGMGLGASVSVDLCHRSGLKYMSHGFQTQGTIAARAVLKVRPKSTCVPGPWILDPRYGCHRSGLEGATGVDLCTWAMDFRPKVWSVSTQGTWTHGKEREHHMHLGCIVAKTRGPLTARFH
jgi:hypothetical protein